VTWAKKLYAIFPDSGAQPFAGFKADVDLDIEDGEFEVLATFTVGAANNGLDLATESVSLAIAGGKAAFSVAIPAGSFKKEKSGQFSYQGWIDKGRVLASIRPLRDGAFQFEIEGDRVNLKGVANPVTVSLTIGDDAGSRAFTAKIE
jgi:hypothetical protein